MLEIKKNQKLQIKKFHFYKNFIHATESSFSNSPKLGLLMDISSIKYGQSDTIISESLVGVISI